MDVLKSNIGFNSLRVCAMGRGPMTKRSGSLDASMMAEFGFSTDVRHLLPYLNAVASKPELFDSPSHIRFYFEDRILVLHPQRGVASPFNDIEDARGFMERLIGFLNEINHQKDRIIPRHKVFSRNSITQILKILPKTNCNGCGFNTCVAFASMLSKQQTLPGRCPHIGRPVQEKAIYPVKDGNGKLLSTITLDIDSDNNESALNSAKRYIRNLEQKIVELTRDKIDRCNAANQGLQTPLSKREIQVLQMVACGTTNAEIAESFTISPHTVKSHVDHIFNKLGVNNRSQASVWASRNGII